MAEPVVRIPDAKVALSTASVYPESTATAFEIAARLGYDGVEVMVWNDPVSQDIDALRRLSDHHRIPILAVHAPCLLITQRVWSTDPWTKLQRARAAAERLGASTVVVHPPFRWQRQYARDFVTGIWRMADETDVRFAVENMYPWRYRDREMLAYAPDWDVTKDDYRHFTIDLSHASTARADAMQMVDRMADRLGHVHLADGNGSAKDEHLVPGRGSQPCAELLERLAQRGFDGHVVIEVNTRRAMSGAEREADLAEALAFTRLHLASASSPGALSAPVSPSAPRRPSPAASPAASSPPDPPDPPGPTGPTGPSSAESSSDDGSRGPAMPSSRSSSRSSSSKSPAGFRRPKARRR
ncbi:sugar phosphate isomerase/epimerase [Streptomyces sp. FL07-04A]|uniref:sugar phosphate isomerase/epimerase family protein n=1 Tax=Streptomyces sp. FL07-04A TaxID=3028658 RepID=UPI0029AE59E1|nr:sugar phosphate isomerase/epimerase [Streptomyces sp. FL07-04A]MDX3579269.1 sugar phosphate isomerase/epimerase [Streptomyces sp. FL07-04A]